MKYLLLLPFAFFLGLAVGSWSPKQDLLKARQELKALEKKLEKQKTGGKLSALNSIIKIPENRPSRKAEPSKAHVELVEEDAGDTLEAGTNFVADASTTNAPGEPQSAPRRNFPNPRSKNFEEELEEAKELWKTRAGIARSQWQAKLSLSEQECTLFDQALTDMNNKLYLTMEAVAKELQSAEEISTELSIRIVNAVTTTLMESYEQIGDVLLPEERAQIEEMQMQDFIDPTAFEPLVDVWDKL